MQYMMKNSKHQRKWNKSMIRAVGRLEQDMCTLLYTYMKYYASEDSEENIIFKQLHISPKEALVYLCSNKSVGDIFEQIINSNSQAAE